MSALANRDPDAGHGGKLMRLEPVELLGLVLTPPRLGALWAVVAYTNASVSGTELHRRLVTRCSKLGNRSSYSEKELSRLLSVADALRAAGADADRECARNAFCDAVVAASVAASGASADAEPASEPPASVVVTVEQFPWLVAVWSAACQIAQTEPVAEFGSGSFADRLWEQFGAEVLVKLRRAADGLAAAVSSEPTVLGPPPPPSAIDPHRLLDQIVAFVFRVVNSHSWYKHLPLVQGLNNSFSFAMDLTTRLRTVRAGEKHGMVHTVPYVRGDGTEFHYTWCETATYRANYGFLNWRRGTARGDAVTTAEAAEVSWPRPPRPGAEAAGSEIRPAVLVPKQYRARPVELTAVVHGRGDTYELYTAAYEYVRAGGNLRTGTHPSALTHWTRAHDKSLKLPPGAIADLERAVEFNSRPGYMSADAARDATDELLEQLFPGCRVRTPAPGDPYAVSEPREPEPPANASLAPATNRRPKRDWLIPSHRNAALLDAAGGEDRHGVAVSPAAVQSAQQLREWLEIGESIRAMVVATLGCQIGADQVRDRIMHKFFK